MQDQQCALGSEKRDSCFLGLKGLVGIVAGLVSPLAIAGIVTSVTEIGSLGGETVALGINNLGQVVGLSYTTPGQPQTAKAFLYSNGTMLNLGTLGGTGSSARAINDLGQVVGYSATAASPGVSRAFMYQSGSMTDLGTLGDYSLAWSINSHGQVVGYSGLPGPTAHAFSYSSGVMGDLQSLLPGNMSVAYSVNDSGQIVGYAGTWGSGGRAFIISNGVFQDLSPAIGNGSNYSFATSINNAGVVVGSYGPGERGFRLDNGVFQDLGSLGVGGRTQPFDINEAGDIVGYSFTAPDPLGVETAFLYRSGVMHNLNEGISLPNGAHLIDATAINDVGQLVANDSLGRAYILTVSAVPELETYLLYAFGLTLIALRRIRRQSIGVLE